MNIEKIFGIILDPGTEDGLELLLSDRFSELGRKRLEPGQKLESKEKYKELEDLVMEHYPGTREAREGVLNWLADYEGEANEDFYLLGIKDGIRVARCFTSI